MNDLTLESLAKRVEALEKVIATKRPDQSRKDWRKVIGMFRDSEFMREVDEECLRGARPNVRRRGGESSPNDPARHGPYDVLQIPRQ